ncbi:hypothetical protein [Parasitella parasitica]|uniref:NDT80 domain-containing protein n=1 Tax=Parasitella parasitica TaxID=35722 RepID=A0A0B7MRS8_9FUNG|nr:hypothetical protein [Parasitella parasitica]
MTSYVTLPYSSYSEVYPAQSEPSSNSETSSQPVLSPPLQQGLMSISQPETPRPEKSNATTPPQSSSSSSFAVSPNLIRRGPPVPRKHASFTTTTFHSNHYPGDNPVRRRRTESIFSFEMGPSFTGTKQLCELYSMDQSNRADQDWTCYRRNYFQISSAFDIHGINYIMQGSEIPRLLLKKSNDSQELLAVDYFSIGVSARVTNNDKKIDLVQHTPKRDKGPQMIPEPKPVCAGGNLHLASVGSNHSIATFERLQFKTATANNGKRRAAQQYYEIAVHLYANFPERREPPFLVASCVSPPLVVRGRSPGHYADSHTRFKHMDTDPSSISNDHISLIPMGVSSSLSTSMPSLNEERFGPHNAPPSIASNSRSNAVDHYASSSSNHRRFTSLPDSPVSDLGFSSYNVYPYPPFPAYSPMMASASASNIPSYAHTAPSNYNPMSGSYLQNENHHPPLPLPSPHIYDSAPPGFHYDNKPKSEIKHDSYWHQSNHNLKMNDSQQQQQQQQRFSNNGGININSLASNNHYECPSPHEKNPGNGYNSTSGLDGGRPQ